MMATSSPTSAHARADEGHPRGRGGARGRARRTPTPRSPAGSQQGADYIKIVIDLPGFDQQTVDALVAAAHARGLQTVAHASRSDAVAMARDVRASTSSPTRRSTARSTTRRPRALPRPER